MVRKRIELTTVGELIEELNQLPPESKVWADGTYGYMHIMTDKDGTEVSFDEDELEEFYEEEIEE